MQVLKTKKSKIAVLSLLALVLMLASLVMIFQNKSSNLKANAIVENPISITFIHETIDFKEIITIVETEKNFIPVAPEVPPLKNQYKSFKCWDKIIVPAIEDTTYKAIYEYQSIIVKNNVNNKELKFATYEWRETSFVDGLAGQELTVIGFELPEPYCFSSSGFEDYILAEFAFDVHFSSVDFNFDFASCQVEREGKTAILICIYIQNNFIKMYEQRILIFNFPHEYTISFYYKNFNNQYVTENFQVFVNDMPVAPVVPVSTDYFKFLKWDKAIQVATSSITYFAEYEYPPIVVKNNINSEVINLNAETRIYSYGEESHNNKKSYYGTYLDPIEYNVPDHMQYDAVNYWNLYLQGLCNLFGYYLKNVSTVLNMGVGFLDNVFTDSNGTSYSMYCYVLDIPSPEIPATFSNPYSVMLNYEQIPADNVVKMNCENTPTDVDINVKYQRFSSFCEKNDIVYSKDIPDNYGYWFINYFSYNEIKGYKYIGTDSNLNTAPTISYGSRLIYNLEKDTEYYFKNLYEKIYTLNFINGKTNESIEIPLLWNEDKSLLYCEFEYSDYKDFLKGFKVTDLPKIDGAKDFNVKVKMKNALEIFLPSVIFAPLGLFQQPIANYKLYMCFDPLQEDLTATIDVNIAIGNNAFSIVDAFIKNVTNNGLSKDLLFDFWNLMPNWFKTILIIFGIILVILIVLFVIIPIIKLLYKIIRAIFRGFARLFRPKSKRRR